MEKFITSLFDFSFSRFVTPTLVKVLYVVVVIAAALGALVMIFTGFKSGPISGIISLVIAPIAYIIQIAFLRLGLEMVICVYRIASYSAEIARSMRKREEEIHHNSMGASEHD